MMNQQIAESLIGFEHFDGEESFVEVKEAEIYETSRWRSFYVAVYRDLRDETFWEIIWSKGSTELQGEDCEDISFRQVEPKLVTVTKYFPIKDDE
jgi:hypothetical protein